MSESSSNPLAQSLLSTPSRSYRLDKLTGPNYLVWRVRMELMLQRAELWDVIGGEEEAPPDDDATGLALWKQKDRAARMEIIVHLGDRQVQKHFNGTIDLVIQALMFFNKYNAMTSPKGSNFVSPPSISANRMYLR